MSEDPRVNPYAPPAEASRPEGARLQPGDRRRAYADERRSIPLLFLLSVVTLNLYPSLWFIRRRAFLDSLDSDVKLGPLAVLPATAWGVCVVAGFAAVNMGPGPVVSLVLAALNAFVSFRVAAILSQDFARAGLRDPRYRFVGAGTLFFTIFYLQMKINRVTDRPRRTGSEPRSTR